jgi:cell division protein FtsW
MNRYKQPNLFLIKQMMWVSLGVALLAVVMRIDYRQYRRPIVTWGLLGLTAAALIAVLFSAPVNNARRWFAISGLGIQPSELAKLATVFVVAAYLERQMPRIRESGRAVLPIALVVLGLCALVVLEPDLGTAMSLAIIATTMVFAAGLSYSYLVGCLLLAAPVVGVLVMGSEYRRRRIMTFLDPWQDPRGDGFQVIQSMIAVGTGGATGRGLMEGVQKLFYLPEPHTDFIYAVIGEELGLVGATLVMACFCVIAWRGARVALRAPDTFGALLAVGLTTMIAVQAFVNMSVVLGLLPTKGLPLPFVSAGGSSLLVNFIGMGVLLNVSQHASAER